MNIHQAIYTLVYNLNRKIDKMAFDVAHVIAVVAAQKTVNESAIALLTSLHMALRDVQAKLDAAVLAGDPVAAEAAQRALDAALTDLEANTSALAVAVTENTIAAPVLGA